MTSILKDTARSMLISKGVLLSIAKTAPHKYRQYTIPKRDGGRRNIAQPTKAIKICQRHTIKALAEIASCHEAATAYRAGISIRDNASVHMKNDYLLKVDLTNFFTSITPDIFFQALTKQKIHVSDEDEKFLGVMLFYAPNHSEELCLSIGAPSSPFVSNIIMKNFDMQMSVLCKSEGVSYTRYADDMTFSTSSRDVLFDFPFKISEILTDEFHDSLKINTAKTIFSSKAHNRHVTGITLNNEGVLSLGRKRKRFISSLVHKASFNSIDEETYSLLRGLLAFANDIEPSFITRLEKKYGKQVMQSIKGS